MNNRDRSLIFARHGFTFLPQVEAQRSDDLTAIQTALGTVLSNLHYFGYIPSQRLMTGLMSLDVPSLTEWWAMLKPALEELTGDNRKMDRKVVYKNFPHEVLEKTEAEYWVSQILMYWGFPSTLFAEAEEEREQLDDIRHRKVIDLAPEGLETTLWQNLVKATFSWNDAQKDEARLLFPEVGGGVIDAARFGRRTNAIMLAADLKDWKPTLKRMSATDVLRLAAALSDEDVSLRVPPRFTRFPRPLRRQMVQMLEGCGKLEEDIAARPEIWKRLLSRLHPGDFRAPRVRQVYDRLYKSDLSTFASLVEAGLAERDIAVLDLLKKRPGEFARRLHHCYALFGRDAFNSFVEVLPSLTTSQILKLEAYFRSIGERKQLFVTPRGQWSRAQVVENRKPRINFCDLGRFRADLEDEIAKRLLAAHPEGFRVDPDLRKVRIQSNGQELAPYGRGTAFDIPEDMTFIRTASYWQCKGSRMNVWYDNGVNFFDDNWEALGAVCWDNTHTFPDAVVFSGDPTIANDPDGAGCQMIDLYPSKLLEAGVRYVVWNLLCYSSKSFAEADEVLATLQWGTQAQEGELYEPSRAQLVFPVRGDNMSCFVAYLDLKERKLVYMDAAFPARLDSANSNSKRLASLMPAFLEHLDSLPSMHDLFSKAASDSGVPAVYSDESEAVSGSAYVFRSLNEESGIAPVSVDALLKANGLETDL